MKWFTHKAVAVAGALAAGAHPAALFAVMIGSVLPDMVDTAMARGDKKVWRRIHRQTSHWFGWYLVIIILGFLIPTQRIVLDLLRATHITFPGVSPSALAQVSGIGNDLLVWVGIGGLIHVLLDALTPMRVPLYPFGGSKRFGINLVSTGTWRETIFLFVALGAIALQFDQARAASKGAVIFWQSILLETRKNKSFPSHPIARTVSVGRLPIRRPVSRD
ncbi:MAG: metal-dependent hydrolase [Bilophila wadsworthia]